MQCFVLLAGYGELPPWEKLTQKEQAEGMERHQQFDQACRQRPGVSISPRLRWTTAPKPPPCAPTAPAR
jgi:hypothetical protein